MTKLAVAFLLLSITTTSHAVTKCIINGKTIYKQSGECPDGKNQVIKGGTFSGLSTSDLRNHIAQDEMAKQIAESKMIEQAAQMEASRSNKRMMGQIAGKQASMQAQISAQQGLMQSQMNRMQNQMQQQQIQQNLQQLMR